VITLAIARPETPTISAIAVESTNVVSARSRTSVSTPSPRADDRAWPTTSAVATSMSPLGEIVRVVPRVSTVMSKLGTARSVYMVILLEDLNWIVREGTARVPPISLPRTRRSDEPTVSTRANYLSLLRPRSSAGRTVWDSEGVS
jgi:hypothetical protein